MQKQVIGVKVGSKLLTDGKGRINLEFIQSLCIQVAQLKRAGHQIFVVTSGAIASEPDMKMPKNLRSSIGQPRLMSHYIHFLEAVYGIKVAQFTPPYQYLEDGGAGDFPGVLQAALLHPQVVPVINYPDFLDGAEIQASHDFSDNDKLFKLCCLLAKTDLAVIACYEDGFRALDGSTICEATLQDKEMLLSCCQGGNELGHGGEGMRTKVDVICDLTEAGMRAVLAPGREPNFLLRTLAGERSFGFIVHKHP